MGARAARWMAAVGTVALVGAACSGSDVAESDGELDVAGVETTSPDAVEDELDATEEDGDGGDAEPAGDPEPEPEPDPEEAEGAAMPGPRQPVKVTYTGTSIDEGSLTLVYERDRFAIHFEDGRLIQTETQSIICSAPGDPCFATPTGGGVTEGMTAGLGGFFDFEEAIEEGSSLPGSWQVVGGRTIAGRDATCAEFDPNDLFPGAGEGTASYCFDPELGVGLSWTFVGPDGEETMEATEVTTPTEADFEPTGPVQSFDTGE